MTLPSKVREAGEAADAALQALKDGKPNPLEGSNQPPAGGEQGTPPGAEGAPPATTAPDTGTPPDGKQIDWKAEAEKAIQRYNVLNGKYRAEVPVLQKTIDNLETRLNALESGKQPPKNSDTPESTTTVEVPEDIKEMYGDNLPEWVQNVAKAAATDAVKPLADKVEKVERTSTSGGDNSGQAFFDAIVKAHPDWETINALDAFHKFLAEKVDNGLERQDILEAAHKKLDPGPVIAQFTEFKKRFKMGSEQSRLSTQVVPDDTGGSPPPDIEGDDKIKESDIAVFYKEAAKGKYKGNPKEFKRLEDLIRKAAESGNIIMDVTPPPIN